VVIDIPLSLPFREVGLQLFSIHQINALQFDSLINGEAPPDLPVFRDDHGIHVMVR